ncbi:amino acid ABC transporter permease [Streptomyces sp. AN091965]|uniref:amino acid ABC transporter permease n=1 Tax=Streptomyces sp. AN091965 TaxID=2927803 RepID=UPI001F600575|nr:amino acid ABC transporter permease [Streptomyces sp. AN091965]MCI3934996.1 amino acid ABC transporter permease [Streptomyces sp. AN091965]
MTASKAVAAELPVRRRRGLLLAAQYLALAVAVFAVVLAADWSGLQHNFAEPHIARAMFPDLVVVGLRNTVLYTATGYGIGFALGLGVALLRTSRVAPYRWLAAVYVEVFRGLPALLVFAFIGVGLPLAFPGFAVPGGVIGQAGLALGLVSSAYLAETFRAGIAAVPRSQVEAALSLGMSDRQAMTAVVLPQALRTMVPPLTNELVAAFKDSSLVLFLGVSLDQRDLAKFGQDAAGTQSNSTPIIAAGCCYLLVTVPLAFLVRRLEARRGKGGGHP